MFWPGLLAGVLRHLGPDREAIWSFSPLFDLSIYHWIRRSIRKSFIDWQTSFFFLILGLEFIRIQLHRAFPRRIFALDGNNWLINLAIYAGTVMAVAIALKVLNNVRIEMKLEQQERLLLQARMEALQSQINPHFLFNTLNSVASLVRRDPDSAREMIVKLGNILRRLLRKGDSFVPLREELEFLDDYLDIEVARFGRDKLKVVKELEPASLDHLVPSMILQPLVENAVKHGFASKVDGGSIYIRSRCAEQRVVIEVEDDGVGMSVSGASTSSGTGIGMVNVTERLQVVYGDAAEITRGEPARPRDPGADGASGAAGRRNGRFGGGRHLRRAVQHVAIEPFVHGNDFAGAESRLCTGARLLTHLSQLAFRRTRFQSHNSPSFPRRPQPPGIRSSRGRQLPEVRPRWLR